MSQPSLFDVPIVCCSRCARPFEDGEIVGLGPVCEACGGLPETVVTREPCRACSGTGIHPGGPYRYFWARFNCQVCRGSGLAHEIGGNQ